MGQTPKMETHPGLVDRKGFGLLEIATTREEVVVGGLHRAGTQWTLPVAAKMIIRHPIPDEDGG